MPASADAADDVPAARMADKPPAGTKVPTRRFGRTGIQMPVLTCGGMRAQFKWGPDAGMSIDEDISAECQANFDDVAMTALSYGINHFETARGYGCSELQFCRTLQRVCETVDRSEIIVQTKVPAKATAAEFRAALQTSFDTLQPPGGYVDLFAFHGLNTETNLAWIKDQCYAVAKEFQAAGKIKWIGFSTHAMTPTIVSAIETGLFDYVNLHYHFIGSNTSTGTGALGGFYCNKQAIEAAKAQDMGMFIISPSDKGGQLYMPPKKFADACAPLSPIEFNNLWLLQDPDIHTLVVGAAFPSDFDEHVNSIRKYDQIAEFVLPIEAKLNQILLDTFGGEFLAKWWQGLPDNWGNIDGVGAPVNLSLNPKCVNYTNVVWLWMLATAWDFVGFCRYRYKELEGNTKNWDKTKTDEENVKKQLASWNPGVAIPEGDLEPQLGSWIAASPFKDRIVVILTEAREMFKTGSATPLPPYAYDMRPETEWPRKPKV
jgi:predicted aldo/keto reductase-like oxidoreductase